MTVGGRGGEGDIVPVVEPEPLRFEWDPAKSASNKAKHGVDFEEAKAIWRDPDRAQLMPVSPRSEPRQLIVGLINGKMYTAVITLRNGTTRIISVRRSRRNEEEKHHAGR
ncbi:MAG: BrnT family toxin [Bifidobacteriaceae bacterium]|nr:BrnT family toxin [Bifidobacteriaceae bacterium]